ncbi:MAG: protein kinase [Anaerolineae bacterium]|nr:protein kinase [Anaerolineae bacterium]
MSREQLDIPRKLGRYEIIEKLGSGGYADVYKAKETKPSRQVALKILQTIWMYQPGLISSFEKEADTAANLVHPHILTVYGQGEFEIGAEKRLYISVEYINGGNLEEFIEKEGKLTSDRVVTFVQDIADALDFAHSDHGVIHRDVKPSNILIRRRGGKEEAVLADFGIAKAIQDIEASKSIKIVGTTPYMAPEQLDNPRGIDHRADIYALGVVTYQMLVDELPFKPEDKTLVGLADDIRQQQPPSLVARGIPTEIERVVFTAMAKDRDARYTTAGDFARELEQAVARWRKKSEEQDSLTMLAGLASHVMRPGKWRDAAGLWEQCLEIDPDNTFYLEQLDKAKRHIDIEDLTTDIGRCKQGEDWNGAIRAAQKLLQFLGGDEKEQIEKQIEDLRREQHLGSQYTELETSLADKDYSTAIQCADVILEQDSQYKDTAVKREQAIRGKVKKLEGQAMEAVLAKDPDVAWSLLEEIEQIDEERRFLDRDKVERIKQSAQDLRDAAKRGEVSVLMRQAYQALNDDPRRTLALVAEIQKADPYARFHEKEESDDLERRAKDNIRRAQEKEKRRRLLIIGGAAIGGLILIALCLFLALGPLREPIRNILGTGETPTPTVTTPPTAAPPTAVSLPGDTRTPTPLPPTDAPTPTPTRAPTVTPTDTPTATPTAETPTPEADAIVKSGGAELRPGCTTWWYPRHTLSAGTELDLLGQHATCSGWVYVGTTDGRMAGWTQVENLELYRSLSGLPSMIPQPTLAPTPDGGGTTPPDCTPGAPLTLDAWPINTFCTSGGWIAEIFVAGHGGDCLYTYRWEDTTWGPMRGSMTFEIESSGYGSAIAGEVYVTSGGQTISAELYVSPPACAP